MKKKPASTGKIIKTINFDKIVLDKLEDKARKEGTTVSNLVNFTCKKMILKDINYYKEMAKHHYLEFQKYKYLKDQLEENG